MNKLKVPINAVLAQCDFENTMLEPLIMTVSFNDIFNTHFRIPLMNANEIKKAIEAGFKFYINGHSRLMGDEIILCEFDDSRVSASGVSLEFYDYLVDSDILKARNFWDKNVINKALIEETLDTTLEIKLPTEKRDIKVYTIPGKIKTYIGCKPDIKISEVIYQYMQDNPNFDLNKYNVTIDGEIIKKHGVPVGFANEIVMKKKN